jgi:hypothetical protein
MFSLTGCEGLTLQNMVVNESMGLVHTKMATACIYIKWKKNISLKKESSYLHRELYKNEGKESQNRL